MGSEWNEVTQELQTLGPQEKLPKFDVSFFKLDAKSQGHIVMAGGKPADEFNTKEAKKQLKGAQPYPIESINPGVDMSFFHAPNSNLGGFVSETAPKVLNINTTAKNVPSVVFHENEHSIHAQNLGDGHATNTLFDSLMKQDTQDPRSARMTLVSDLVKHKDYLETKLGFKLDAYFQQEMIDFQGPYAPNLFAEQLATLASNAAIQKIDLTKDNYVREHILYTPALRETFNALLGVNNSRAELKGKSLEEGSKFYSRVPEPKGPDWLVEGLKKLGVSNPDFLEFVQDLRR